MRFHQALLGLSLVPVLALASCGSPNVWVKSQQSLELTAELQSTEVEVQKISCETHNGRIDITADSATSEVKVEVSKRVGGYDEADADLAMAAVRIIQEKRGDTLHLAWEWSETPHSHWGASVSFTITSPQNLKVEAVSHNGRITIAGTGAPVRAETHNGRIKIVGVAGRAYAHSHNGPISVAGSADEVDVHTHNGHVDVETSGAAVHGSISTHNGGIEVELSEAAATKLTCKTWNGSISTGLTLSGISTGRHSLVGTVGKGGGDLRVETHNGSIRVK